MFLSSRLKDHSGKDYNSEQLAFAIDCKPRNKAIVNLLQSKVIGDKTTAVSCVTTTHAENLCNLALEAGLKASYVHSDLLPAECTRRREMLNRGEIQFLFFVNQLTEAQVPRASCS